ncbi:hypothetical protein B0H10DRAFT_2033296 [Mycena sp. CBHHK59/15]|nr:hypothetical protein B0H10DRAFT_2033296 [Mycena sp. CBHHK59/15]
MSRKNITPLTTDRVKWNEDWEREIARWTLGDGPKPIEVMRSLVLHIALEESEAEMQHMLAEYRSDYGSLCDSLTRLSEYAVTSHATRDLRNKWLSSSDSVRQVHILDGLARACRVMDSFRWLCEELTLPWLQRGEGQGFLDLLQHFTLDDFSRVPEKPIYLKSRHWYPADPDAEPKRAYELADAMFNVQRSWLIGYTLTETLRSFHEIPQEKVSKGQQFVKRSVARSRLGQVAQEFEELTSGSAAAKEKFRKIVRETKGLHHVAVCENCRNREIPGGQRYMRCKPCMENVSRQIYYCSRQCQREDYKPRHKRICGKPLTVKDSVMEFENPHYTRSARTRDSSRIRPDPNMSQHCGLTPPFDSAS